MSYAIASALQSAVYRRLMEDSAVAALVGDHIYDAPPAGSVPDTYISLGPETVVDASDATGGGAQHSFDVSSWRRLRGFKPQRPSPVRSVMRWWRRIWRWNGGG